MFALFTRITFFAFFTRFATLQRMQQCNNARHRGILQTAHRILSPMVIIGVFGFSIGDRKTENENNPMVVYTVTDQDFMGLQ